MKGKILIIEILCVFTVSVGFSQKIISEKQVELTKDQKKYDPDFALPNQSTNGVTVYFEPHIAPKVEGEKRKYERYELQVDKDLNMVAGDFKTLETKNSPRPKIKVNDFSISYSTWVEEDAVDKVNKMMLQITKFDIDNNISNIKSYVLCEEKGFDNYRVTAYKDDIIVFAQYEKKKTIDKNEKNRDYVIYKRINANTLELKNELELNLLGKDELGLETFNIQNDKIFLVGSQLVQSMAGKLKTPQSRFIFRLDMDGTEEIRGDIALINKENVIASIYICCDKDMIYLVGEYGDPKSMQKISTPPYGSTGSSIVKCTNPNLGIFIKKFNFDLQEKVSFTYGNKEIIQNKLKKGNPGFIKSEGNYNFQNFYFLGDGSFYLTAEIYTKDYKTVLHDYGNYTNIENYTDFAYSDGLCFKFNENGELNWLVQIDRDKYTRSYSGFIKSRKPLDEGKLISYLMPREKLVLLYNSPGKKYNDKRFGLSEVIVIPDGQMTDPYNFTNELQFGLLDGGIIDIGNQEILAIGTDKLSNNLWIKKIKIFE